MRLITFLKFCPIRNSGRILNTTDNQIFTYTSRAKLFLSHGFYEKVDLINHERMKTNLSRIIQFEKEFRNALFTFSKICFSSFLPGTSIFISLRYPHPRFNSPFTSFISCKIFIKVFLEHIADA